MILSITKGAYLDVYQEKDKKANPVKAMESPLVKEEDVGIEKK